MPPPGVVFWYDQLLLRVIDLRSLPRSDQGHGLLLRCTLLLPALADLFAIGSVSSIFSTLFSSIVTFIFLCLIVRLLWNKSV